MHNVKNKWFCSVLEHMYSVIDCQCSETEYNYSGIDHMYSEYEHTCSSLEHFRHVICVF